MGSLSATYRAWKQWVFCVWQQPSMGLPLGLRLQGMKEKSGAGRSSGRWKQTPPGDPLPHVLCSHCATPSLPKAPAVLALLLCRVLCYTELSEYNKGPFSGHFKENQWP